MAWSDFCPELSYIFCLPLILLLYPLYVYFRSEEAKAEMPQKHRMDRDIPAQICKCRRSSFCFLSDNTNILLIASKRAFLEARRRRRVEAELPAQPSPTPSNTQPTMMQDSWPRVWSPEAEANFTGFLGFQAAAAEGETHSHAHTFYVPEAPKNWNHQHQNQYHELIQKTLPLVQRPPAPPKELPSLPAEIHLQIIKNLLPSSEAFKAVATYAPGCGLCNLFQVSSLCRVNRFYYSAVSELLYTTLPLNVSTEVFPFDGSTLCEQHHHLSSKPLQLEKRIPLLLRTLRQRPDLASSVKGLHLPPSINCWLTCGLEKVLIPNLIQLCENMEIIRGVEQLHERQFFSAEHYCLDGEDPAQHGILAKTIVEKKSLARIVWRGGDAGNRRSVWARVFDGHPDMRGVGFVEFHKNWSGLKELGFFGVRGLTVAEVKVIFEGLPGLEKFGIGDARKKVIKVDQRSLGHGDPAVREARREVMERFMSILEVLPNGVRNVGFSDIDDEDFVVRVGRWVAERVATSTESAKQRGAKSPYFKRLTFSRVCFTPQNLGSLIASLAIEEKGGRYSYSRSAVRDLRVSNFEKKDRFIDNDINTALFSLGDVELRGLERLCWGVGSCEDSDAAIGKAGILKGALNRGWFKSLKEVLVESDLTPADVVEACERRNLDLGEFCDVKRQLGMVEW